MAEREARHRNDAPKVRTPARSAAASRSGEGPSLAAGPAADLQAALGNLEVQRRAATPAIQTKLNVSEPGDPHEVEADRVADAVLRAPDPAAGQVDEEEVVATKLEAARQEDDEEEVVATKLEAARQEDDEEEVVATKLEAARQEDDEEEVVATKLEAARQEDEEEVVATKADGAPAMTPAVESGINASRGGGHPMDTGTRAFFEPRFGREMGGVKVHTDAHAARLASDLRAQAFTVGRDVYFAGGRYQPGTESGRRLLAHELTHTVQQQPGRKLEEGVAGVAPLASVGRADRQVQRTEDGDEETDDTGLAFHLPQIKARHMGAYQGWAASGNLFRNKAFARDSSPENTPDQRDSVWLPDVTTNFSTTKLDELDLTESFTGEKTLSTPGPTLTGNRAQLLDRLAIPQWDRAGTPKTFHVDHIIELQAAGWPGGAGNTLQNMELLDASSNSSAGGKTRGNISRALREYLGARGDPNSAADATSYMQDRDVRFSRVVLGTGSYAGRQENRSQWWTRDEILRGDQLQEVQPVGNLDEVGDAQNFALLSPVTTTPEGVQVGGRALLGTFRHRPNQLEIGLRGADRSRVAGLNMSRITLISDYTAAGDGEPIGTVEATWALPPQFQAPADTLTLPVNKMPGNQYAGHLAPVPPPQLDFEGLSLIHFDALGIDGGGLSATGRLSPSIPLLNQLPIEVRLRGRSVEFGAYYSPDDLDLPVPGVSIDEASLGVFYNTEDGFGAEGEIHLSVDRLGEGSLTARVAGNRGLDITGSFGFDTELFDEASIEIWYRDDAFGGRGTLAITDPDKVRGIRSARITAAFEAGRFAATGDVMPDLPGVEAASLTVSHSEEEGLEIGGTLSLSSDIPGIQSGSVEVGVRRRSEGEGWKVSATGRAVPDVPGIDSAVAVSYDDGIFTAEVTAQYSRGMLDGSLRFGATNRPVDESGTPGDEPTNELRAFGGGSLTLTLTPWLAATAGVRITPEAELEVTGRIGLPAAVDLFPARRYDRNVFRVNIDIPIVGVSVLRQRIGIFATIGGGLDLSAGFGPGQLRDLHLSVTYNPDHEEDTLVEGAGEFFVPADAGLRLFVRGALGAGIPVVSASAGLEVGGQLGIDGAVRAGVQVSWTPTQGLDLEAEAEIYAEPKFKFDITGFVMVEADLLLRTIELYSKRWRLAEFEYGSGLRLGATFPLHYREGQPFDVSMDDIEFQVPDIDPMQLLTGLVRQLA
jgi:hypothetical protein